MGNKILLLNPPSPPYMNVSRDWAGGMGTALPSERPFYGHDINYEIVPYMSLFHCLAILKNANYNVTFLDGLAERLDLKQLIDRINLVNPSILITVINLPSIYGDLRLIKEIRSKNPELKIIIIGTICKVLPEMIIKSGLIDYIILSDPEVVILELIEAIEKSKDIEDVKGIGYLNNGEIILTQKAQPLIDLNSIPMIPYHLLPMDNYRSYVFNNKRFMMIFSSRGCPFKCSYYCPYPLGFGNKVIFKDPLKVSDEIQMLREEYSVEGIIFRDQNFTLKESHATQICDELIKRRIDIQWICETRFNLINEKLLKKMKNAGCKRIHFGLETGDNEQFINIRGNEMPHCE